MYEVFIPITDVQSLHAAIYRIADFTQGLDPEWIPESMKAEVRNGQNGIFLTHPCLTSLAVVLESAEVKAD